MSRSEKFLVAYSGLLTAAFAVVVLTGASSARNAKFDEIDVQRINVREADGTLRLVIANNSRMPTIYRGKEYPHPQGQRGAGIMFYNDEGTENGGLTFVGKKGPDGKGYGIVHLSFDQYEQDQVLVLEKRDMGGKHSAGLKVIDRPEESLVEMLDEYQKLNSLPPAERDSQWQKYEDELKKNYQGGPRLFIGKNESREAILDMKDAKNRTRLRLRVDADGEAKIEFLAADGKVQRTLTPEKM